jgi:hypothetical protein
VQGLVPPQKFEVRHFGVVEATGLKMIKVIFNGINSLPNFMETYQSVEKLLVGTHGWTDRQTTW